MNKTTIIASIVKYLEEDSRSTELSEEKQESLQVAIQCIRHVYGLDTVDELVPSLKDILTLQSATTVDPKSKEEAEGLKTKGNQHLTEKNPLDAIDCYTRAIHLDSSNPIYFCNRAAAYTMSNRFEEAVTDCNAAIALNPKYAKAYGRLGAAYTAISNKAAAISAYEKALELEPENQATKASLNSLLKQDSCDTNSANFEPNLANGFPPNMDLNSLLSNPDIMKMASQMLNSGALDQMTKDPNMMNMMQNMLRSGGARMPNNSDKLDPKSNSAQVKEQ